MKKIMKTLKFHSVDPENCRIYFTSKDRQGKKILYCVQNELSILNVFWWGFYCCSENGEPSHAVDFKDIGYFEVPESNEQIVKDFFNKEKAA